MSVLKKVLIISYYWPPSAGIAVQRNLKLAKYLPQFGWEPIIYAPSGADYPGTDHSNAKDVSANLKVVKGPIWEPYKIYRKLTGKPSGANVNNVFYTHDSKPGLAHRLSVWVRSNFFIPDARCMWIKPSVKNLIHFLKNNPVDAIFSDGPPHSNTRIACILKQKTGIPWLADFQDPWTQVDYYQLLTLTKWADQMHRRMEQEAFQCADHITIVSKTWKKELEKIGAKNVAVIPWGYDQDDYAHKKDYNGELFSLTHSGILGYDRLPLRLLEIVSSMIKVDELFKEKFRLILVGQVDHSTLEKIEQLKLTENVLLTGSVDRKTSLGYISSSAINLLLLNQQANVKGRIPGKLFEYLATRRPILCLGDQDGDSAEIILKSQAGYALEYNDEQNIRNTLKNLWEMFMSGKLTQEVKSDILQYTNYQTTKKFAGFLDGIVKS